MKKHKCDVCNKIFTHLGNLLKHTSTHSDMNRHCGVCNNDFIDSGALIKQSDIQ